MRRPLIAALMCGFALTATAAAGPVFAADDPAKPDAAKEAKPDKDDAKAPVAETAVPSHRSIPVPGRDAGLHGHPRDPDHSQR